MSFFFKCLYLYLYIFKFIVIYGKCYLLKKNELSGIILIILIIILFKCDNFKIIGVGI